jgi:hypothetical protein
MLHRAAVLQTHHNPDLAHSYRKPHAGDIVPVVETSLSDSVGSIVLYTNIEAGT